MSTERKHAASPWRLPSDTRLRLRPMDISVPRRRLCDRGKGFETAFLEGILERDPCHEEALQALGYLYTAHGKYAKGLEMDLRLIRLRPDNATVFYDLACSYSRLGDLDRAFEALERSLRLGFCKLETMDDDPDLENVRSDPRYPVLRERAEHHEAHA